MHQINYKITVQYEGTRYKGWQKQPGTENTIQGKLETLLSRCLDTPIEVWGAGRTDAGVHALGQTANFWVPEDKLEAFAAQEETSLRSMKTSAEDAALFSALNHYLPEDIAVPQMVRASERFHALPCFGCHEPAFSVAVRQPSGHRKNAPRLPGADRNP